MERKSPLLENVDFHWRLLIDIPARQKLTLYFKDERQNTDGSGTENKVLIVSCTQIRNWT